MSFSPRFSPDGQRVIMSLQEGSNSNIFVMDLRSKATTRLTNTPAIDTAPSYSPDGQQICFESDRGGSQQIYVMSRVGRAGAAHQLRRRQLFDAGVVAARRLIAFTKQGQDEFAIGVMSRTVGRAHPHRRLPQRGADIPPNGRVIMFFRDPGGTSGPSLFTIDISGRNELRVPTPGFASDPAWSPLLS